MDKPSATEVKTAGTNKATQRIPWLNVDKYYKGSHNAIAESIQRNMTIAVCDGSYKEVYEKGCTSWVISCGNKDYFVTAGAISPGTSSVQLAYRSKVLGLLGTLDALLHFCEEQDITNGKCTIFCDRINALHMTESTQISFLNSNASSVDLLSACIKLRDLIPIHLDFFHVKGHRDDHDKVDNLSIPSQLNVMMDFLAKDLLQQWKEMDRILDESHPLSFTLPMYKHISVYGKLKDSLYNLVASERANKYWLNKDRYTQSEEIVIDWNSQEKAMASIRSTKQQKLTKWFTGWMTTGRNMKRCDLRYSNKCPSCGEENETTDHILHCPSETLTTNWKNLLAVCVIKS